jgi:2-keto-3-deoxy-L-rhamnonate aldolase RhmA
VKTKNVLRELMKQGKPTIGTRVYVQWPGMTEVIGHSGVIDYVQFEGQYAPYDLFSLENFGRAVGLFDHMSAMMKLDQSPKTYLAERAVGSGIQNLLFADIRTVDDARLAVASMRPETPESGGIKGVAGTRDMGYVAPGITLVDYIRFLEDGVLALMIEKKEAVDNLEEILSVPGVDMVQFGRSDYSMSIGLPGQIDHPDVHDAEMYMIKTALEMGVNPRVDVKSGEDAQSFADMGVKDFTIGTDINIVYDYCKEKGGELAKLLGK